MRASWRAWRGQGAPSFGKRFPEELALGKVVLQEKEPKGIASGSNSLGQGLKEEGELRLFQACTYPTKTWLGWIPVLSPPLRGSRE